ncbi:MAG TPA: ATP-dependent DNA helicase RecG [Candidatus Wildermuthbacteria bacterium]|nr:ATP-dependent DNA helicase RecG [Candidatus Wildermuthbacteria bacterium]
MNLSTPITQLAGVGPIYEKRLKRIGITIVRDLLFHFPRDYQDFSKITSVSKVKEGETYCLKGRILDIKLRRSWKRKMSIAEGMLEDKTGTIRLLWFNQPYITTNLNKDDEVFLVGKVTRGKRGIVLSSPSYEKVDKEGEHIHVGRLVPIYPETAGVSSRWIRYMAKRILDNLDAVPETLPKEILKKRNIPELKDALKQAHFPDSKKQAEEAKKRFGFEELFHIMLFVLTERRRLAEVKAISIPFSPDIMKRLTNKLPYDLTDAQKKAVWHILKDIEKPRPMNRLLEGDVGSGKTIVAAMASLAAVRAGYQVAILAPTEILAKQHFRTIGQLLTRFRMDIGLLTGKEDKFISRKLPDDTIEISRKKLLERAKDGSINLLIGTHTLIQDKVKFANLALVIVDEQHRFGVQQRAKLLHGTKLIPHLLSMTATPIPRTLALSIYGDLDLTVLDELPKGRKEVKTSIIPPGERENAYKFMAKEIEKGRQVFVICPRIEAKTDKEAEEGKIIRTVQEEHKKLEEEIFPDYNVDMLHGKMTPKEKESIMQKFKRGTTDVLVSTSVVEVGVDIPNASVMLIEGVEHFGLAQLHQFRGRVGRAEYQSYCFLFTDSPSQTTRKRLRALATSTSGFELAEQDLKIRGPGDFTGLKQWGMPDFAMTQLLDLKLVKEAREAANEVLEKDLQLKKHPGLKKRMAELRDRLHLE